MAPTYVTVDGVVGETRQVPVDSVATEVVRYAVAKKFFFVVSTTALHTDWLKMCHEPLGGIWLLAHASPDPAISLPNKWKVAFELKGGKMVTLELYDTESTRGSVPLFRTLHDDTDANPSDDWKKLAAVGICHIGRCLLGGIRLRDVISTIETAGLSTYQLKDGRGSRHWIVKVLSEIGSSIREAPRSKTMSQEADDLMRKCWIPGGAITGAYGWEDEPDNRLNIKEGEWNRGPATTS